VEKFQRILSEYVGARLHEPRPVEVSGFDPHLGWHPQGNGKWYYGLSIENGRVKDEGPLRLRSALRTLIERYRPEIRLTPLQDILLCGLEASARGEIEQALAGFGVLRPDQISTVQRYSMACPAIPTCGLALTESERALPSLIDQLEIELKRLGLENEKLTVRMTGCPNGCARPYQSDIGLVGRSGDKFTVFVGGDVLGTHLNFLLRDLVPVAEIVPLLVLLLEHFKQERRAGEGFGAYCRRSGVEALQALLPDTGRKNAQRPAKETGSDNHGADKEGTNGDAHRPVNRLPSSGDGKTASNPLAPPETRLVPLGLPPQAVTGGLEPQTSAAKQKETFLAGRAGEERPDYTYLFNSDGSVRNTVVYYYGTDLRAASARKGDPLHRKAIYQGLADPVRLHAARKLSDTLYVGPVGHVRRDVRIDYQADGQPAHSVVFLYEGEARAAQAPSGAPLRRQVTFVGKLI
jgi:hypothetical protein